jgi:predicted molibdopterin-dependent oxidoreductase YjgC
LVQNDSIKARLAELGSPSGATSALEGATEAAAAIADADPATVAIVFAPSRHSGTAAGAQARAAVNLAIALAGPDDAPSRLHVLPPEANVVGARDLGVAPNPAVVSEDDDGNTTVETEAGLNVQRMLAAARAGDLKALIIAKDNPLLTLPDRAATQAALAALDLLLVIDDVATDTVAAATHVLADVAPLGKDGSTTNADRQILRLRPALAAASDARSAWEHLSDLAARLGGADAPTFANTRAVMDAIASEHSNYAGASVTRLLRQTRQPNNGTHAAEAFLETETLARSGDGLALIASRDLYTDRESAAAHLPDADRMHRGESLELHPDDASARSIADGDSVQISSNGASLTATARVSEEITPGTAFLPLLWEAGAVQALIGENDAIPTVEVSKA